MMLVSWGDLMGGAAVIIGAGWVLLQIAFRQFERRLDEKFAAQAVRIAAVETLGIDIKRLELELVRRDNNYVARGEYNTALQRIFDKLETIDQKVSNKVDRAECARMMNSKE